MSADQSAEPMTFNDNAEKIGEDLTDTRGTQLRRRMRDLVAHLMHDVLRAMAAASPAEIGEFIVDAEASRQRNEAASAATRPDLTVGEARNFPLKPRVRSGNSDRGNGRDETEEMDSASQRDSWTVPSNDPFDITSPSELLASTDGSQQDQYPVPPVELRVAAPPTISANSEPPPADSVTALPQDKDAASERRPRVVLREGESLLSATGSGVVIRRERRIPSAPR